jgi:hypothetical protein
MASRCPKCGRLAPFVDEKGLSCYCWRTRSGGVLDAALARKLLRQVERGA